MFSDKPEGRRRIDLNADVGEHAGDGSVDRQLVPLITSANIACGLHAGGPTVIRQTIELAATSGVAIGAHPSFDDRDGFGRVERHISVKDLENLIAYQVGAVAAIAALHGCRLQHVKPHGALFNMAARDRAMAETVARATKAVDGTLILFGPPGSELVSAGLRAGLTTAREAFADRGYRDDGSLVPRSEPHAVIHDPDEVVSRAISIVFDRVVTTASGARLTVDADTICVHGDTPGAADLARLIRRALADAGADIRAVGA